MVREKYWKKIWSTKDQMERFQIEQVQSAGLDASMTKNGTNLNFLSK